MTDEYYTKRGSIKNCKMRLVQLGVTRFPLRIVAIVWKGISTALSHERRSFNVQSGRSKIVLRDDVIHIHTKHIFGV